MRIVASRANFWLGHAVFRGLGMISVVDGCAITRRARASERQGEPKGRSAAGRGANLEGPAVRFGDRARDEQAQAGSGLRVLGHVGPAELLEDQPLVVWRDPRATVANLDDHAAV